MSDEAKRNQLNTDNVSKDNGERIQKRQITITSITAIAVAIIGAFTAWNSSQIEVNKIKIQGQQDQFANQQKQTETDLNTIRIEMDQNKLFNERLKSSLNDLKDVNKAQLSIVTLYPLAETDKDKCILLMIARISKNPDLGKTLSQLIEDDRINAQDNKCIKREKQQRLVEYRKLYELYDKQPQQQKEDDIAKPGAQADILAKLTPRNLDNKWILVGVENPQGGLEKETISIKSKELPKQDSIYKVIKSVNLRDRAYSKEEGLGNILGVISEDSKIKIIDSKIVQNKFKQQTVWVKVQIL